MQKPGSKLFYVVALLLGLAATAVLQASLPGAGKVHLQKDDCAGCHLGGRDVTPQQAGMLVGSQEALCGKCHPAAIRVSHPSGFQPRNKPVGTYPLDWKGDLTCSTCHEVHGSRPALLRGNKAGRELCFACHETAFFQKMRDGGASLMVGHLSRAADPGAALIDVYSRQCMECHGNAGDPRLATRVDRNGISRHARSGVNHPVGVNYQKAAAFGGYRARRAVEKKLLLPDGMVSCVSCHGGYQKDHGKLLVPVAGSGLCYECHDI
ncbi:MAG TPA: cytochrome c3 family protein [Noviherbaspirillum sp.]